MGIKPEIGLAFGGNQLGPSQLSQGDGQMLELHPALVDDEVVERFLDVGSYGHRDATRRRGIAMLALILSSRISGPPHLVLLVMVSPRTGDAE
jgi:hypothetical protein